MDLRKILHIDMDAFYASVEQREKPRLRGRPVVVGGSPDGRGVVASASYEARRFGVHSAMSCSKARRLCPEVEFVLPDFQLYSEVSEQIQAIFLSVTPLVEPLALDEAFLDVTENALGEGLARRVALHVKERIRKETGLTASAGAAPNKFLAKIASDLRKPNGLVVIPPERVLSFLEDLPVEKIWSVGPVTAKKLHRLGLRTAGEIQRADMRRIEDALGSHGLFLFDLAHGHDPRPVEPHREAKSRGAETTFERDVVDLLALEACLRELSVEVAESLREMACTARTVTLKVRYDDFHTITRRRTLARGTAEATDFLGVAVELLHEGTEAGRRPVRLLGVAASNLGRLQNGGIVPLGAGDEPVQLWLPFFP